VRLREVPVAAHREGRAESALESTLRRCRRARVGGLGQSEARRVWLEGEEQQGAPVIAPGADETSRGWLLRVSSRRRAHGGWQLLLTCEVVLLVRWGVGRRARGWGSRVQAGARAAASMGQQQAACYSSAPPFRWPRKMLGRAAAGHVGSRRRDLDARKGIGSGLMGQKRLASTRWLVGPRAACYSVERSREKVHVAEKLRPHVIFATIRTAHASFACANARSIPASLVVASCRPSRRQVAKPATDQHFLRGGANAMRMFANVVRTRGEDAANVCEYFANPREFTRTSANPR